jgi:serralysin
MDRDVVIDLRPASLVTTDAGAGGNVSRQWDIGGGFTIAHGVTIENAYGGQGDDLITGNAAANNLRCYAGADLLRGLDGNDLLQGGSGDDRLLGYDGNDTLSGGSGCDVLSGGTGRDVFIFDARPSTLSNRDKIADFNVRDDTIDLENAIFTTLKAGKLPTSAFWIGPKAHDSNDRIIYDNKKGILYYDPDGTGDRAPVQFAILSKSLKMTAADFLVI